MYGEPADNFHISKRSIYYAAREISEQLGILTETTDYSSVEKVYCIWICNNKKMPRKLQNTVSEYYIAKRDLIGYVEEPKEDYDLIDIIMIRRGEGSFYPTIQTQEINIKSILYISDTDIDAGISAACRCGQREVLERKGSL